MSYVTGCEPIYSLPYNFSLLSLLRALCKLLTTTGFHCLLQCEVSEIPGGHSDLPFQVNLSFHHSELWDFWSFWWPRDGCFPANWVVILMERLLGEKFNDVWTPFLGSALVNLVDFSILFHCNFVINSIWNCEAFPLLFLLLVHSWIFLEKGANRKEPYKVFLFILFFFVVCQVWIACVTVTGNSEKIIMVIKR